VFTVAFRGVDLTVLRNLVNFDGGYSSSRIQTIVVVLSMAIVLCDRLHHCDFYQIAVKPFVGLQLSSTCSVMRVCGRRVLRVRSNSNSND